jgi:nitrite reductase/ring-hydroxylating ferredoxin subunit
MTYTMHKVGKLEEFPVGKFRILKLDGIEVGIIRLKNGEIHAVRNTCPHKVAPICRGHIGGTWPPSGPGELKFERDGEILVCPRHGWEYDVRSGFELYQERPAKLKKYDVKVDKDEVTVAM